MQSTQIVPGKTGKLQVADAVFMMIKEWERDSKFEVSRVSDLIMRVRYRRTDGAAPRYFEIKVSEPF